MREGKRRKEEGERRNEGGGRRKEEGEGPLRQGPREASKYTHSCLARGARTQVNKYANLSGPRGPIGTFGFCCFPWPGGEVHPPNKEYWEGRNDFE